MLGLSYFVGYNVAKDLKKARLWFRHATKAGDIRARGAR